MPDIVDELRIEAESRWGGGPDEEHKLENRAADEIERLRAALGNLREALEWIAEDDGGRAGDCARDALGIKP